MSGRVLPLGEILSNAGTYHELAWLYLPNGGAWDLDSEGAILIPEEVPPELDEEPDASVPEFAKARDLCEVLQVATIQDIVRNARMQKPNATGADLLRAFKFYYDHDAFIAGL